MTPFFFAPSIKGMPRLNMYIIENTSTLLSSALKHHTLKSLQPRHYNLGNSSTYKA